MSTTPEQETVARAWEEFCARVRENDPEHAHTLEWDEHPEDWEHMCYCGECLSYD